ncbi:hypothetical protein A7982_13002 [Minicystis rosea]|nr:hypothetical protein A7982_13002 [Minicystis rosea]
MKQSLLATSNDGITMVVSQNGYCCNSDTFAARPFLMQWLSAKSGACRARHRVSNDRELPRETRGYAVWHFGSVIGFRGHVAVGVPREEVA